MRGESEKLNKIKQKKENRPRAQCCKNETKFLWVQHVQRRAVIRLVIASDDNDDDDGGRNGGGNRDNGHKT